MEPPPDYTQEIDYTFGYYGELAPSWLDLALILEGFEPPPARTRNYLELGFGQGLSINIHAAAAPVRCWGADFNPRHAANAQALARASGVDAALSDASFEALAADDTLPAFDYIVMHGIWSWVSDDVRGAILTLLQKRLRVGGVIYISYNALPGWAPATPLQHLLATHAALESADTDILRRVDSALAFANTVTSANARFFLNNPAAAARLTAMATRDRRYLAHEYLGAHCTPFYFSDVAAALAAADLEYAGSAIILDHLHALHFTLEQQAIIGAIKDAPFRETVRDFFRNQEFRRDMFVKGARRLSTGERQEKLFESRWALTDLPATRASTITTALGRLDLKPEIYDPLTAALMDDHFVPKTLRDLAARADLAPLGARTVLEALIVLTSIGHAHPAQAPLDAAACMDGSQRLTNFLLDHSQDGPHLGAAPSPVIGAGVRMTRIEQVLLCQRRAGLAEPDDWARAATAAMTSAGRRIAKQGSTLQTEAEIGAELQERAKALAQRLPLLEALGVAPRASQR